VYFNDDSYIATGKLHNNSGNQLPLKVQNYANGAAMLWVPDWQLLGAQYGASVVQLYALRNTDSSALGGRGTLTAGFFNTIVEPIDLSWNLGNGFFTSTGMSFYLLDGHYEHSGRFTSQGSYANNFWTFEPNFGISYLRDGLNLSVNNVVDINTENNTTRYQSGTTYYLDATATRTSGPWTYGLIGNYTQQIENDRQFGATIRDSEIYHLLVGPMLSYNFGKVTLTGRYLQAVETKNDINASFFHLSIAFPL
jgi:hypothetical protein